MASKREFVLDRVENIMGNGKSDETKLRSILKKIQYAGPEDAITCTYSGHSI